ncbi:MAG TPA: glycosyltransferase family 2 protein [Blastocatellia bacterium]|nr:glycosyltransferase family 2 protein [Blastocatellia bacterium]
MYKGHRITVVVPAHNEARHIGDVIRTMPGFVDHIVVVDDCSSDETFEIASASTDHRVIALRTEENSGVGGATIMGYRRGLEIGSDILVKMDGDGQMDPAYLSALLDPLVEEGYDYTKGNRFLSGESLAAMPKHRLFGNIVLTFMTKLASGYWQIFDPQNGYTAIKAAPLKSINLNRVHNRFFFENDILIQLNFHRFRVKDVAIPARYGEEVSDINIVKIGFTFPLLLLKRFFHRVIQKYVLRDFSPIALFLFSGLILFGWGFFFGIYLFFHTLHAAVPTPTGTIMLSLLPLILGFQLILQAIVLDIQETPK